MPRTSSTDLVTTRRRTVRKPAIPAAAPVLDGALGLAHIALDSVDSKKASQIVLLDVQTVSMFTDYFLLCNGESERQIKAIAEGVEEALAKAGTKRRSREGTAESGWILLDYGDLMVHIFAPEQRDYYQLEELWKDAKTVVKMQ
jgi:ribosome-associated protein